MRVVVLLPGGVVADDRVLAALVPGTVGPPDTALAVPPGARTVACLAGGPEPAAVAGWAAGTPVAYLGDEVWLGAGVAVRSAGRVPARGLASAPAGWVVPDALVAGETAVVTTFADPAVSVVAVSVEGGAATAEDVAFGLDGAVRAAAADGRPRPPVVVADGARTVAVYAVEPDVARRDAGPVTVTVASAPGRRLAGVAGARDTDPDRFAAAVAARGLDDLLPPAATDGLRRHRVSWKEA